LTVLIEEFALHCCDPVDSSSFDSVTQLMGLLYTWGDTAIQQIGGNIYVYTHGAVVIDGSVYSRHYSTYSGLKHFYLAPLMPT